MKDGLIVYFNIWIYHLKNFNSCTNELKSYKIKSKKWAVGNIKL